MALLAYEPVAWVLLGGKNNSSIMVIYIYIDIYLESYLTEFIKKVACFVLVSDHPAVW